MKSVLSMAEFQMIYREVDRLMVQLLDALAQKAHLEPALADEQIAAIVEQVRSANEYTRKQ
jgi:hypothetical protein